MSTVAVLDVFLARLTIKHHTSIRFDMRVLLQISFATILPNILKIEQQHTE